MQNLKPLANLHSWAGQFESYLVGNPEDRFFHGVAHIQVGALGEGGGTQIWNWYICAAQGLKHGGLREQSLTENGGGGLSERRLTGKTGDFGAKNNGGGDLTRHIPVLSFNGSTPAGGSWLVRFSRLLYNHI